MSNYSKSLIAGLQAMSYTQLTLQGLLLIVAL